MRLLLVSFHFPPDAPLAARRPSKLARHLIDAGWDLRVLTAQNPQPEGVAHALEIEPWRVIRTPWTDWRTAPDRFFARFTGPDSEAARGLGAPSPADPGLMKRLRGAGRRFYEAAVCLPDGKRGWNGPARAAALKLFETWRPDVVYASAPPHSSILLARDLARRCGAVWGAEFRDRWARDGYSEQPAWRRRLDERMEAAALRSAGVIGTVSPPWAEDLARLYGPDRVILSMNGFDPEDQPLELPRVDVHPEGLTLLYAGALYPGKRELTPLFEGLRRMGAAAKDLRLDLYGDARVAAGAKAAQAMGLGEIVRVHPPAPHAEIVRRQYAADVNVMLGWNDPREGGTIPGKLFELAAARRPVLMTGWEGGAAAALLREKGLGVVANDPAEIAAFLAARLAEKRAEGAAPVLSAAVRAGLSRAEQFAPLERALRRLVLARAAEGVSPAPVAAE